MLVQYTSFPTSPDGLYQANPYYDESRASVYFVDRIANLLYRFSLTELKTYTATVDGLSNPSFIIPSYDDPERFLVGSDGSGVVVYWNGRSPTANINHTVFTVEPPYTISTAYSSAFNELYIGPTGIEHCVDPTRQSIYRYSKANGLERIASQYQASVGLFMVNDTLFHLSGCSNLVTAFERNPENGELGG